MDSLQPTGSSTPERPSRRDAYSRFTTAPLRAEYTPSYEKSRRNYGHTLTYSTSDSSGYETDSTYRDRLVSQSNGDDDKTISKHYNNLPRYQLDTDSDRSTNRPSGGTGRATDKRLGGGSAGRDEDEERSRRSETERYSRRSPSVERSPAETNLARNKRFSSVDRHGATAFIVSIVFVPYAMAFGTNGRGYFHALKFFSTTVTSSGESQTFRGL